MGGTPGRPPSSRGKRRHRSPPRPPKAGAYGDHMNNPTPDEIVQIAQSGQTGQVKTLSDLRFEKLEARLQKLETENAQLRALNEEYRAANTELFALASKTPEPVVTTVAPQTTAVPQPVPQTAQQVYAAQVPEDTAAKEAQKAKEESMLSDVLAKMGYKKTSPPDDGM